MTEIEVKILEVDTASLKKKLIKFGASKVFEGEIKALFFDFEGETLRSEKKRLRLRTVGNDVEFTLKERKEHKSVRIDEEFQVLVGDFKEMKKILEMIGLKVARKYTKHRVSYVIDKVRFEFDTIENLPTLLEIEAQSVEDLEIWVKKLGFKMSDTKPWSGRDVLCHYEKIK